MTSTRQLKTKIRAVRNIRQITRAMQMVAATKMRRSQEVALNARPYAKKSFALLLHLLKQASREEPENVFWTEKPAFAKASADTVALVVITSDKGLAGSFNSSVLRAASQWKKEQSKEVEIITVGRKARDFFRKQGNSIAAEFLQFSDIVTFQDVRPLADWILRAYEKRAYDTIVVCSNQFVSALLQRVEIRQILPLEIEELQKTIDSIIPKTGKYSDIDRRGLDEGGAAQKDLSYVLEPSREAIMQTLVRNLIQVQIAYFVFESNASEHSARMVAMKNATENADRLQEKLTLELNKARQAAITQEIAEVTTAKEALTNE